MRIKQWDGQLSVRHPAPKDGFYAVFHGKVFGEFGDPGYYRACEIDVGADTSPTLSQVKDFVRGHIDDLRCLEVQIDGDVKWFKQGQILSW